MGDADDMVPDRIGDFNLSVNLPEPCIIEEEEKQQEETSGQDKVEEDNSDE